jgi:hypothetical protein
MVCVLASLVKSEQPQYIRGPVHGMILYLKMRTVKKIARVSFLLFHPDLLSSLVLILVNFNKSVLFEFQY